MAAGRFREDLYYRLAVIPITMPPLRERLNDIIPLAESFIKKYSTVLVKNITLSESTRRALLNYRWPGNVRQLENAIQRGMILNRDGVIYPGCLRPAGNGRCRPQRTAMACSARRPHCRNQRFGPARTKRPVSIYR
ncbi:putative sigma-54 specific transcriptional regulator [Escherichia coli]|uniref:Putative sigma-54 specific transcriptional regulator n=1 Tax=Escherichia coli TaxID=562 RepID=A0A2X1P7K7_ECOLX|nr:putative sigma-54 specific transcriptional regulator [Escherichia coli]